MRTTTDLELMLIVQRAEVLNTDDSPPPGTSMGSVVIEGTLRNNSDTIVSFSRNGCKVQIIDEHQTELDYVTTDLDRSMDSQPVEPAGEVKFSIICDVRQPVAANVPYTLQLMTCGVSTSVEFQFEPLTTRRSR